MKLTKSSNSVYSLPQKIPGESPFANISNLRSSHHSPAQLRATLANFRHSKPSSLAHSNLGSFHNTRGKLQALQDELQQVQAGVKQIQNGNKELRLKTQFMKQQLLAIQILQVQRDMQNKLKLLKKQVTIGVRSDCLKFNSLQQIVQALGKNYHQIAYKMQSIEQRITLIENAMGDNNFLKARIQ